MIKIIFLLFLLFKILRFFFKCKFKSIITKSGLLKSKTILKNIKEISIVNFDHQDVMRDPLVTKIVEAYQKNSNDKG